MSWQNCKLGDFISIKHGWAFKGEYFSNKGDYLLLTPGNAYEQGGLKLRPGKEKFYLGEFPPEFLLKKEDIIVIMTDLVQAAPILGGAIKIPQNNYFLHNQRLGLVEIKNKNLISKNFLYYLLNSPSYRAQVRGSATGATVRHTAPQRIYDCSILIPKNIEEQDAIANILLQYDTLIENNRKRIALLEESARLLYQEWFVKFRFPNAATRKGNLLPQNWQKITIGQLTSFLSRGITPRYDENAQSIVINQKCIRDGLLNLEFARRQSKEVKPERLVQKGDILINSTGTGTLGRVAVVRSNIPDCTVDTHVTIVRPLDNNKSAYLTVTLLELENYLSTMGIGSTNQQELNRADIAALSIIEPPEDLQIKFHEIVWPIFEQTETLLAMNKKLKETRDELLPKLISGQIQV